PGAVEDPGNRRRRRGPGDDVTRSGTGHFGYRPDSYGVVIAAGEHWGAGRGTHCGRMKSRVPEPLWGEPLRRRGPAGAAEGGCGTEPDSVDHDHQDVRRSLWGTDRGTAVDGAALAEVVGGRGRVRGMGDHGRGLEVRGRL